MTMRRKEGRSRPHRNCSRKLTARRSSPSRCERSSYLWVPFAAAAWPRVVSAADQRRRMSRPVSLEHTRHLARCREATLQYSETQQPLLLALKPARTYPRRVNPQPEILRITVRAAACCEPQTMGQRMHFDNWLRAGQRLEQEIDREVPDSDDIHWSSFSCMICSDSDIRWTDVYLTSPAVP
jgi:hypothetical protein